MRWRIRPRKRKFNTPTKAVERVRVNEKIPASELRVIGDDGTNYGVIARLEALQKAREAGLDLIEIAPTAVPPVAKIMDYGKYRYVAEKKQREGRQQSSEVKGVRVGLGTSQHDLEMKAKKISEFLGEGHRVKLELVLRGRAKYLEKAFLEERLKRILDFVAVAYKFSSEPTKAPRGISAIIESAHAKKQ